MSKSLGRPINSTLPKLSGGLENEKNSCEFSAST